MSNDTEDLIRLSFFTDMAQSIASAITLEETLSEVMRHVGGIFAPRNWSLLLRDAKTDELVFTLVTGGEEVDKLRGRRLAAGKGIAGWIATHQSPLVIPDVTKDPRFDPSMDAATNFVTKSIIGVPLASRGQVFGVIELVNKLNGEPFTALDLKILSTIADFAATAIEKAYYLRALRSMALEDDLTGLANRRALSRAIERETARTRRTGGTVALLMVDIDDFKTINDTLGHGAGDEVLKHLAVILKRNVREIDVVCRYGGDEFAILMPETTSEAASEVRGRILNMLASGTPAPPVRYRISVGVHAAGPDSIDSLFERADLHLYREKDRKREADIENVGTHIVEFLDVGKRFGRDGVQR